MRPILIFACLFACQLVIAQSNTLSDSYQIEQKKNLIKLNLTSPILKNYSVQYERILNKKVSLAFSGRIMPSTTMPFKETVRKRVLKDVEEDANLVTEAFENARFSNFALTPEMRYYLGKKGYGRGFYIGAFYRYASYKATEVDYSYDDAGENIHINLDGKLKAHTGGLLFGAQWMFTKTIGLDWWILGPSVGGGNGRVSGLSSRPLEPGTQEDIRDAIEKDVDIPFSKKEVHVDANGASLKLTGPWAGVRAGLLLTFRF